MNVPRAFLAAVGAFWSELIPSPSLWDYEGAALADREAEIDSWEPDGLLGREPSHADFDDDPFVSDSYLRYNDAVPAGVCTDPPVLVPPAGLPFTFNAGQLVTTATALILDHYHRNGAYLNGELFIAGGAAEVVVSQLVADLTAAYTAAAERAAADSRINRALTDAGFETGQDMGASMYASEFFPQHTRKSQK